MATAAPKRITRLRSHESSVRTVPERNVKPRKVVTRSSKKINISVKNKNSRVSKGNVSLRNNQTPMIRRLRPRQNRKNYCEDSRLLQRYILSNQQDSVVVIEKLDLEDDKKVPVYKTVDPPEKSLEDKNDIYDFKFDLNDTTERAKKKQGKRKINKGKGKTTKKTTRKKVTTRSKTSRKVTESAVSDANLSVETAENNPPLELEVAVELSKEDIAKKIDTLEIDTNMPKELVNTNIKKEIDSPRINTDIQMAEKSIENIVEIMEMSRADTNVQAVKETTLPYKTCIEQKKDTNKPKVISVENANNIIVTKSPHNNTKETRPFRPKNILDNKTSVTLSQNNSLLMKTLSPIQKTNFIDFGSPWRSPTLTFSQTKHFTQSTPLNRVQPYKPFETLKENKKVKKSTEMNKKNIEIRKENMEMNKENKENIDRKDKRRKKEKVRFREKQVIQRKLPMSENQAPENVPAASNSIVQPAPIRISLGEIKNLQRMLPNVNGDNKQTVGQSHTEVNETLVEQKDDQLKNINFSDTFDVMSETEKLSKTFETPPLFMDLEPTHFLEPPQHSYRRKRTVKFEFSEDSGEEEEEKNVKSHIKKKKPTKSEKEREKKITEWANTINTTFQEIDEHPLIVEKIKLEM